ncbi:hypothetical protein EV421DRAFT_1734692 [Armillaria borealis]|uniref:Uncharacterized protein n=1 Tax=Armillaria borealis TaxID=47425 RepID=A0AA39MIA7_9AGAR|nr:hypothetical protein EV421DRAFT_1740755 [Armillaria borealis]KAK0445487.1 hypothetical protein EV421DRAFT_1734692 [Armillaria borealis]
MWHHPYRRRPPSSSLLKNLKRVMGRHVAKETQPQRGTAKGTVQFSVKAGHAILIALIGSIAAFAGLEGRNCRKQWVNILAQACDQQNGSGFPLMVKPTDFATAVKRMREKFILVPVDSLAFDFGALALWQAHKEKACVPHTIVTYLMQEMTE